MEILELKKGQIKVVALDLDGTLTNSDKIITEKTKSVLKKASENGVKIVLASGRPTFGIIHLAKELHLADIDGYILSNNGGLLISAKTGEIVHKCSMNLEYIPELCDFAKENSIAIQGYDDFEGFSITESSDDFWLSHEAQINHLTVRKVSDLYEELANLGKPIRKLLMSVEPERMPELEAKLAAQFEGRLDIFHSAPFFLEAVPLGCSKASALAALLEKLNLSAENLMACGDSANDMAMIKFAGLGVAMDNAEPQIKEIADFITLDNDNDGVAFVLEKII